MAGPTAQLLAERAAARRHPSPEGDSGTLLTIQEHERRQNFRRLIDRGIFRQNSKPDAMKSLETLSKIAENILREPENPKYQTFKHENDTIKRRLIETKGALEYALALGFRGKVAEFQSHYVFNPKKMDDLRVGAAILSDALDRETQKEDRAQRNMEEQRAAAAAAAQNVKLAFLDDRKTRMIRDQRERALRETRGSVSQGTTAPLAPESPSPSPSPAPMPGIGHTLINGTVENPNGAQPPPPYDD